MRHPFSIPAGVLIFVLGVAGCQPTTQPPTAPSQASNTSTASEPAAAVSEMVRGDEAVQKPQDVKVEVAGREAYDELLEQHRGKVVLVDFWATWCLPCVKQFPHTVELGKKHLDDGLVVISVSFDDVLEPENVGKVLTFLQEKEAVFDNLISEYGIGVESAVQFEVGCEGALPFYKLYDRKGQLRFEFCAWPEDEEGIQPLTEIDAKLQELLAE
jgi:thiol-disulfide isomerase/thioredoxin